jgi:hypothetical protein
MPEKKNAPERRSGLRPSENELPERCSGVFRHKIPLMIIVAWGIQIIKFLSM